jgi:hypothetical protein
MARTRRKSKRSRRKKRSGTSQASVGQATGLLLIAIILATAVSGTGLVTLSSGFSQPYVGAWEVNTAIKRDALRVNGISASDPLKQTEWGYQHVNFDMDPEPQANWPIQDVNRIKSGYADYYGTADLDLSIGDPENYVFDVDTAEWAVADDDMSYRVIEKALTTDNSGIARYDYHIYRFWVNVKTSGNKVDLGWGSGWHGEASGSWGIMATLNSRVTFSLDGWRIANSIQANGSTYVHDTSTGGWAGVMSAYVSDHGYVGVVRDSENNMGQWNSDAPIARILNGKNSKVNMYTENSTDYYGYDQDELYAIQDIPSAVDLEFTVQLLPAAYANWFGTYRTAMQIVNVETSLQLEVHVVSKTNYVLVTGDPPTKQIDNTYYEPPPPNWLNDSWAWMRAQMWDPLGDFVTKITMMVIFGLLALGVLIVTVAIVYVAFKSARKGRR